jgi:hypothetical protein
MTNHRFVKRTAIAIGLVVLYAVITFAWFLWLFTREKAPPGAKNVPPQKMEITTK